MRTFECLFDLSIEAVDLGGGLGGHRKDVGAVRALGECECSLGVPACTERSPQARATSAAIISMAWTEATNDWLRMVSIEHLAVSRSPSIVERLRSTQAGTNSTLPLNSMSSDAVAQRAHQREGAAEYRADDGGHRLGGIEGGFGQGFCDRIQQRWYVTPVGGDHDRARLGPLS